MTEETIGAALAPTDEMIDRMKKYAQEIAGACFIPEGLRGDTASVFYMLATAQDMGLRWSHGLRSYFPSQSGSLGMKGDIILALLLSRGFEVEFTELKDPIGCACTITRPGGKPVTRSFDMNDAKRIKTQYNPGKNDWDTLADRMLYINHPAEGCQWRSLVRCGRVAAADVIGGLYLPEELEEAAAARANGQQEKAPAADPFVVGEKPEQEDAKPPFEPDTKADTKPEPETVTATKHAAVPDTKPDTKTDTKTDTKPAPKPSKEVRYQVLMVEPIGDGQYSKTPINEPAQKHQDNAVLIARAQASATRKTHVVAKLVDGELVEELDVCNPPSDPAPVAPNAPTPESQVFDTLIAKMLTAIGGEQKPASKKLTAYLAGFLGCGVKQLPKDKSKLTPALVALDDVLDQRLGDLKVMPEALGQELAGRVKSKLEQEFDTIGWSPALRDLARQVMVAAKQDEEAFIEWLHFEMVQGVTLAGMAPEALALFLPIFLLARGRAWDIVEWAVANQQSVGRTLEEFVKAAGKPIAEWDAPFAVGVLDALKGKATTPASAPTPDTSTPAAKDDWADELAFGGM